MSRDKGPDDKAKEKKKLKDKKSLKIKAREEELDGGGWTEVKSGYLTAAVR